MAEYGSELESVIRMCGLLFIVFGARDAYREKVNSGARNQAMTVIGIGLLLIK